jgi:hypothetical protein
MIIRPENRKQGNSGDGIPISIEKIVGPRVAQARGRAKPLLTPGDLSEAVRKGGADIDRAGVARIETGIRSVLDCELVALAKALRVSVTWLLRNKRKRRP